MAKFKKIAVVSLEAASTVSSLGISAFADSDVNSSDNYAEKIFMRLFL